MSSLFILVHILFLNAFAGVGGTVGGSGVSSWAPDLERGVTRDWPLVRYSNDRSYELHELCIENDSQLKTLKPFGKLDLSSFKLVNKQQRKLERVYDKKNCVAAWDPKCALVDKYVSKNVQIPVYRGAPRMERGGLESHSSFISRAQLIRFDKVKVPNCR